MNNFGDAMSELTELGFETDNVDTEVLDQKANELIDEFYEHYDELCAENPNQEINQRAVFEGWVIQKIANLQVITLNQQKMISTLISEKY